MTEKCKIALIWNISREFICAACGIVKMVFDCCSECLDCHIKKRDENMNIYVGKEITEELVKQGTTIVKEMDNVEIITKKIIKEGLEIRKIEPVMEESTTI